MWHSLANRYVREQIPGWATLQLYYDPSDLLDAWILLVNATTYLPQLSSSPTYTADVVAVGSQAMSNLGLQLYQEALGAMTLVNKTVFNSLGKEEDRYPHVVFCHFGMPAACVVEPVEHTRVACHPPPCCFSIRLVLTDVALIPHTRHHATYFSWRSHHRVYLLATPPLSLFFSLGP
jgi:hypothetical protein